MSIILRNLPIGTAADNLDLSLKGSPLTNDEVDQNFINLTNLKASLAGAETFTGNKTFAAGITLTNDPVVSLTNGETLTFGDASNTIDILGDLYAASFITDGLTLTNPIAITVSGDCSLANSPTISGNSPINLDIVVNSTTGNAGSATALNTPRSFSIAGAFGSAPAVAFDGTSNVELNLTLTSIAGLNADTASLATAATALNVPRNFSITGAITAPAQAFDGSGNVQLTATLADESITPAKIVPTGTFAFEAIQVNGGSAITNVIKVTDSVTIPASIDHGDSSVVTVTVSGVTTSMFVQANPAEEFTDAGLIYYCFASAADTISIVFVNTSNSATAGQTLDVNFL
jgi:hypothetical protein